MNSLETILNRYNFGDKIYTFPGIPFSKAKNAIDTYAHFATYDKMLVLIDETVFGSAKDGMVLTHDRIFLHEMWSDSKYYNYSDIESIEIIKKKLILNGREAFSFNLISKNDISQIADLINTLRTHFLENRHDELEDDADEELGISNEESINEDEDEDEDDIPEELLGYINNLKRTGINPNLLFFNDYKNRLLQINSARSKGKHASHFIDMIFSVSQEQINDACRDNPFKSTALDKKRLQIAILFLSIAESFSTYIDDNYKKDGLLEYITKKDSLTYELLVCTFIKAVDVINDEIDDRDSVIAIVNELSKIFFAHFFMPFHIFVLRNDTTISDLKKSAAKMNLNEYASSCIKLRKIYVDRNQIYLLLTRSLSSTILTHSRILSVYGSHTGEVDNGNSRDMDSAKEELNYFSLYLEDRYEEAVKDAIDYFNDKFLEEIENAVVAIINLYNNQ